MSITVRSGAEAMQLDVIHRFLCDEAPWSRGIPRETVARAVAHSLNFGVFDGEVQVAYARVVTDRATFAWLADVFVLQAHRGRGHAVRLMDAVVAHPALQGLRRFSLATSTAPGLYARYGFTAPVKPQILMERYAPDLYLTQGPA